MEELIPTLKNYHHHHKQERVKRSFSFVRGHWELLKGFKQEKDMIRFSVWKRDHIEGTKEREYSEIHKFLIQVFLG